MKMSSLLPVWLPPLHYVYADKTEKYIVSISQSVDLNHFVCVAFEDSEGFPIELILIKESLWSWIWIVTPRIVLCSCIQLNDSPMK